MQTNFRSFVLSFVCSVQSCACSDAMPCESTYTYRCTKCATTNTTATQCTSSLWVDLFLFRHLFGCFLFVLFPFTLPQMVAGDSGNISMYVYVHVHVFAPCCVLFFVCCLQKGFCCFICSASLITYGMCEFVSVCERSVLNFIIFLLLILFPGVFFVYFSLEDFLYIFPSTFSGLRLYDYKWIWLYIYMCVCIAWVLI